MRKLLRLPQPAGPGPALAALPLCALLFHLSELEWPVEDLGFRGKFPKGVILGTEAKSIFNKRFNTAVKSDL